MKAFDKEAGVAKRRRNLPHWEQAGCTYFVTWRLADSLPATQLEEWKESRARWMAFHPRPWTPETAAEYEIEFAVRIERWLDAGHGSCLLRRPDARRILADALHFFDGERYGLDGYVIMPNHVHVLVTPHQSDTGFPACEEDENTAWKGCATLQSDTGFPACEREENTAWKGCATLQSDTGFPACGEDENTAWKGCDTLGSDTGFLACEREENTAWKGCATLGSDTGFPACEREENTAWKGCATLQSDTGFLACGKQPGKAVSLSRIVQSWKGYSAREINRLVGRKGRLWMDENFDHAVRSEIQLDHFRRYLRENPTNARLPDGDFDLFLKGDTGFPACETNVTQAFQPVGDTAWKGCATLLHNP